MSAAWRLIVHGPVDGALNMAIDRAIQICREEGSAPPTLRLYEWSRPTVTLGRFQPIDGIDRVVCAEEQVDVVRRFTGGRGVLHDDELTYSVIAGIRDGLRRGVTASYRQLCSALSEAYREIGVDAHLTTRGRGEGRTSACYLQTTKADLSAGESKLSGSAQVWLGSTVLQHGSLVISRDAARETRVFKLDPAQSAHLSAATVTIEQAIGRRPGAVELVAALVNGWEASLGIVLNPGDLNAREAEVASALLSQTAPDTVPSRSVRT